MSEDNQDLEDEQFYELSQRLNEIAKIKTTLEDINWIKPQKRPRADIAVKTGDGKYKTTFNTATGKFKCSCMGFWRSNGNCKHVKELRESLQS